MLNLLESTRHLRRGIRMVACIAAVWVLLGSGDMLGYVAAGVLVLDMLLNDVEWLVQRVSP